MLRSRHVLGLAAVFAMACGGGGEKAADTSTPAAAPADTTATAAPAPGAPAAGAAATGTAQAITGKTWDVKMLGDAKGYRYDPASLTIKKGDGVRFTVVSTPPHNVTFWPDSIPSGASNALQANMPQTMAPLTGPLLMNPNQSYTISFAGVPAGTYKFYCTPHLAMGMKGTITVQ